MSSEELFNDNLNQNDNYISYDQEINTNNLEHEDSKNKRKKEIILGNALKIDPQLTNSNIIDNKVKVNSIVIHSNLPNQRTYNNSKINNLIKNKSTGFLQQKVKIKHDKFIEINRAKFRVFSQKKDKMSNKDFKLNPDEITEEFEGLLNSIKTNKIIINDNQFISKDKLGSELKRRNENFFITSNKKEKIDGNILDKIIENNKSNAIINNVKFLALSYAKNHNSNPNDNNYPEDSVMKLKIFNENLFKHKATPLNFKSNTVYHNDRILKLKSNLNKELKEDCCLGLLFTSKGLYKYPELKNHEIDEQTNSQIHKLRMEMIINKNKQIKKPEKRPFNIKNKQLVMCENFTKSQIQIQVHKNQLLCVTENEINIQNKNDKFLNNRASSSICPSYSKNRNSQINNDKIMINEDKTCSDLNNKFYTKSEKLNNKKSFNSSDQNFYKRSKFKNFEEVRNAVFGPRQLSSSKTRIPTNPWSAKHNQKHSINNLELIKNYSTSKLNFFFLSENDRKEEKIVRRNISSRDNTISNVLYKILNKNDADIAIQKNKIF